MGGQRRELQERGTGIEQPVDALPDRELALRAVALQVLRAAALAGARQPIAQIRDHLLHLLPVGLEPGIGGVHVRLERNHI